MKPENDLHGQERVSRKLERFIKQKHKAVMGKGRDMNGLLESLLGLGVFTQLKTVLLNQVY
jgi:hypothetical protein